MREILFRGKRISTGEWVEGGIRKAFHPNFDHKSKDDFLRQEPNCYCICTGGKDIFVDQSTIGQFTGLTDKNGTKIFEGDIVDIGFEIDEPDNGHSPIYYERAVVTWNKEYFRWYALFVESKDKLSLWEYNDSDVITVIGNIHDNKELLKGGEGDG